MYEHVYIIYNIKLVYHTQFGTLKLFATRINLENKFQTCCLGIPKHYCQFCSIYEQNFPKEKHLFPKKNVTIL